MTVKDLKEILECLIEDGKGDYPVFTVGYYGEDFVVYVDIEKKEVEFVMTDDRFIAFKLLADKCGKVLGYRELYPDEIFWIAYSYINGGCKSRKDYEYLVNFLFENNYWREELLK